LGQVGRRNVSQTKKYPRSFFSPGSQCNRWDGLGWDVTTHGMLGVDASQMLTFLWWLFFICIIGRVALFFIALHFFLRPTPPQYSQTNNRLFLKTAFLLCWCVVFFVSFEEPSCVEFLQPAALVPVGSLYVMDTIQRPRQLCRMVPKAPNSCAETSLVETEVWLPQKESTDIRKYSPQ